MHSHYRKSDAMNLKNLPETLLCLHRPLLALGDYSGMLLAAICMVHCALTPLALLMPFLVHIPHSDHFHYWMIAIVTLPIIFSLLPGFALHRKATVLLFGLSGFVCFLLAVFIVGPEYGEIAEMILSSIAGLSLIIAHIKNRGYCRHCQQNRFAPCHSKPI
jgi:hypothetical protein